MTYFQKLLSMNGCALGVSVVELNDYLQMGVLVLSGLISIIATLKKYKNEKND